MYTPKGAPVSIPNYSPSFLREAFQLKHFSMKTILTLPGQAVSPGKNQND